MKKRTHHLWFFALVLAFMLVSWADACPTCKEGLNEDGGNLVRGYFWSIMFMMSMPFLILGSLSCMFYLDVRRARRRMNPDLVVAAEGTA